MNEVISNLRKQGKWYIVPAGDWLDSLKADARGVCACGHEIEHSYFAVLVDASGEWVKCVECGSSCIIELTRGYIYKTPSDWVYLTDEQVSSLFWAGHSVGRLGDIDPQAKRLFSKNPTLVPTLDVITCLPVNKFYSSVYEFGMIQYEKTGFFRVTEKQFNSISKLFN